MKMAVLVLSLTTLAVIGCGDKKTDSPAPVASGEDVINLNLSSGDARLATAGAFTKVTPILRDSGDVVRCAVNERRNQVDFWAARKQGRRVVESVVVSLPRDMKRDGTKLEVVAEEPNIRVKNKGTARFDFSPQKGEWTAKKCFAVLNTVGPKIHLTLECLEVENLKAIGTEQRTISLRFQMACDSKSLLR